MSTIKKPYEISLWKDYYDESKGDYFQERKIIVIGSDTMDSGNRAFSPILTRKNNGETTLQFSLLHRYYDEVGNYVINPFEKYLVNERKIKLYYDNKWYDFILKNKEESSENVFEYTASDANVLELSKVGYNIELSTDLNNNQGTIKELAEKILEDTDWEVDLENSDLLQSYLDEPIYQGVLKKNINVVVMGEPSAQPTVLPSGTEVYIFYHFVANKIEKDVQILLATQKPPKIDDNNVIIDKNYRILDEVKYTEIKEGDKVVSIIPDFVDDFKLNQEYQGKRLVRNQSTKYDNNSEHFVDILEAKLGDGSTQEIYHYKDSDYSSSNILTNYFTNAESFNQFSRGSLEGWSVAVDTSVIDQEEIETDEETITNLIPKYTEAELITRPTTQELLSYPSQLGNTKGYLQLKFQDVLTNYKNAIFNSGINDNNDIIHNFTKGEKYNFSIRAGYGEKIEEEEEEEKPSEESTVQIASMGKSTAFPLENARLRFDRDPVSKISVSVTGLDSQEHNLTPTDSDKFDPNTNTKKTFEYIDRIIKEDDPNVEEVTVTIEVSYYSDTRTFTITKKSAIGKDDRTVSDYLIPQITVFADYEIKEGEAPINYDDIERNKTESPIEIKSFPDVEQKGIPLNIIVAGYTVVPEREKKEDESQENIPNVYKINPEEIYFDFRSGANHWTLNNNIINTGHFITDSQNRKIGYEIDDIVQTALVNTYYKDKDSSSNILYKWDNASQEFIEKNENDLDTYYCTTECLKSLSNKEIKQSKIGIFLFTTRDADKYYFIEQIQLFKYRKDGAGTVMTIGNVPNAAIFDLDYYYIPDEKKGEDIQYYIDLKSVGETLGIQVSQITPKIDESCEMVSMIEADNSNCFNIIQDLCEKFECWAELQVDHDDTGHIIYTNGKPNKKIIFKKYIGKDNYAGFKYGVNLETIERTINSDEIVTKLIVPNNNNEYAPNGFCSIQRANSNVSGLSYILNFDYYVSQGLLDKNIVDQDLINYYTTIGQQNKQLAKLNEEYTQNSLSLTNIEAKRAVFTEYLEAARIDLTESQERYKDITETPVGQRKDDIKVTLKRDVNKFIVTMDQPKPGMRISFLSGYAVINTNGKDTFYDRNISSVYSPSISNSAIIRITTPPTGYDYPVDYPKDTNIYYNMSQNEPLVLTFTNKAYGIDALNELMTKIGIDNWIINNYGKIVDDLNKEYKNLLIKQAGLPTYNLKVLINEEDENAKTKWIIDDFIEGLEFDLIYIDGAGEEAKENVKTNLHTRAGNISNKAIKIKIIEIPKDYQIFNGEQEIVKNSEIVIENLLSLKITPINGLESESLKGQIDSLETETKILENKFLNKYSRFIQEGTWNSEDYLDDELYYLDAKKAAIVNSKPKVEYNIKVIDVEPLEEYKGYKFDVGDKTYIEDTEFFGYTIKEIIDGNKTIKVATPVKEEVVVTEITKNLDDPTEDSIVIQNYKTQFEDLFQRLGATVQSIQYNEGSYLRAASAIDTNGLINAEVLRNSFESIQDGGYSLSTNGIIKIEDDGIVITDIEDASRKIKLSSCAIRTTTDNGENWLEVLTPDGISVEKLKAGTIDVSKIMIMNGDQTSFRWDSSGINAYYFDKNEYDLNRFVRFDQFGLYGINGVENFQPTNIKEVEANASFGLTWDGFFIKNNYGNGYVSISSDNDFQVIQTGVNGVDENGHPIYSDAELERIRIGALEFDEATGAPTKYGINIRNVNNDVVFTTDDSGDITITGTINANAGNFTGRVQVGQNDPHIEIDGIDSSIYSSNYQDGASYGWMINKDGDAVFNNITARGAIKTAVFEYAEIQAVGGIFIFRPSSTIRTATISGNNLIFTVEKPHLFQVGDWCKVSNYLDDNGEPDVRSILLTNGLTHTYKVIAADGKMVTLEGAAVMVKGEDAITDLASLEGGALIDMGNNANGNGKVGTSNYGVGINSSDNTVNLPRRAISLFETIIDETKTPKVTYNYRGILGTLPELSSDQVDSSIYNRMAGTQGIYTDNMYIGDLNQYIAFYEDKNGKKQLKIKANQVVYEVVDDEGHSDWREIQDIEAESAIQVIVESSAGNMFLRNNIQSTLTCTVYKGTTDITDQVTSFTWRKKDKDGNIDSSWSRITGGRSIVIGPDDIDAKAIFICEVSF